MHSFKLKSKIIGCLEVMGVLSPIFFKILLQKQQDLKIAGAILIDWAEWMKYKTLRVRCERSVLKYVTEPESRKQRSNSPLCNSLFKVAFVFCFLFILSAPVDLWGQDNPYAEWGEVKKKVETNPFDRGQSLKAYHIDASTGDTLRTNPDTLSHDFYLKPLVEGRALAVGYLGNFNSPWLDKIYSSRPDLFPLFIFNQGYYGVIKMPNQLLYYDTKMPFTRVQYITSGFGSSPTKSDVLDGTISTNLGPYVNIGGDLNYSYINGFYDANRTKDLNYRLFGSLRFPRYEVNVSAGSYTYTITENGGIVNEAYIINPTSVAKGRKSLDSREIPVRYPANMIWNKLRTSYVYLTQRFNLGSWQKRDRGDIEKLVKKRQEINEERKQQVAEKEKEKKKKDKERQSLGQNLPNSIQPENDEQEVENETKTLTRLDTMRFVPVASVVHQFSYERNHRRLMTREKRSLKDWGFPSAYLNQKDDLISPNDSSTLVQFSNTVGLSLREGFKPWMKFGLTAYTRLENRKYILMSPAGDKQYHQEYATYVGGAVAKREGSGLLFDGFFELNLLGARAGEIHAVGNLSTEFQLGKDRIEVRGHGGFYNSKSDYLMTKYIGTFYRWDFPFNFSQKIVVSGQLRDQFVGASLGVHSSTLRNYLFFGDKGLPEYAKNAIQVTSFNLHLMKQFGIFGYELEGVFQHSTNETAIPLPRWAARANLYLKFYLAKVMRTQIGIDTRLHASYYAPYYEPMTMQFIPQHQRKIGGDYPFMTAYANMHLQRTRFFLQVFNVGQLLFDQKNFSLYKYPYNPMGLIVGFSVDFNN